LRDGRLRVKADTRGGPGRGLLGRQLVFGCRSFQLLELQLELVEQVASDATQAGAAFGALAEAVAPQLLDVQLEVDDQGLVIGGLGPQGGRFGGCSRIQSAAPAFAKQSALSACYLRPPCVLGMAPVDPFEQVAKLPGRDHQPRHLLPETARVRRSLTRAFGRARSQILCGRASSVQRL